MRPPLSALTLGLWPSAPSPTSFWYLSGTVQKSPLGVQSTTATGFVTLLVVALTCISFSFFRRRGTKARRAHSTSPPPSFMASFSSDEQDDDEYDDEGDDDDEQYLSDEGSDDSNSKTSNSQPSSHGLFARKLRRASTVRKSPLHPNALTHSLVLITSKDPTSNLSLRPAQVLLAHPSTAGPLPRSASAPLRPTHRASPRSSPRLASGAWTTDAIAAPPMSKRGKKRSGVSTSPSPSSSSSTSSPVIAPIPERNSSYHKAYDERQRQQEQQSQQAKDAKSAGQDTPATRRPPSSILRKHGQSWQVLFSSDPIEGSDSDSNVVRPPLHLRSQSQPVSPTVTPTRRSIQLTEPDWDPYVSFHIRAQERQAKRRQFSDSLIRTESTQSPEMDHFTELPHDWLQYSSLLDTPEQRGGDVETSPASSSSEKAAITSSPSADEFWYERHTPSTAAAGRNWDWRKRRAMQRREALLSKDPKDQIRAASLRKERPIVTAPPPPSPPRRTTSDVSQQASSAITEKDADLSSSTQRTSAPRREAVSSTPSAVKVIPSSDLGNTRPRRSLPAATASTKKAATDYGSKPKESAIQMGSIGRKR